MKIRTGRIDSQFDAQRPAKRELLAELSLADDLGAALLKKGKGFVRLHVGRCRGRRLLVLIQQFSHLLNRKRPVLLAQRLLALARMEKGAITPERSRV